MKQFGVSTHLYHEHRLDKSHFAEIASAGFEAVEVFATRSHFDYHDERAIRLLKDWLTDTGLELHSIHAPITDVFANGRGQRSFSIAIGHSDERSAAMREMEAAVKIARLIPFKYLVVHLGVPLAQNPGPDDNDRDAALRSVEEIHRLAEAAGVRIALEVMGNDLSTPFDLVDMLERSFEGADLGICMDVGHAHMLGDTAEAIETSSEYLITTHIHDNRRQSDDHLVPFQGNMNWAATMMAFEKIGYDGVLMYEVKAAESTGSVLERAVVARMRLEALMSDSSEMSAFSSQQDE